MTVELGRGIVVREEGVRGGGLPPVRATATGAAAERGATFQKLLGAVGTRLEQGEALVRGVVQGRLSASPSPTELLALQAGIYRYGEVVDLTAKLVDRAGSSVRTVLQGSG